MQHSSMRCEGAHCVQLRYSTDRIASVCRSTAWSARGVAGLSAPPPPAGRSARARSSHRPGWVAASARRWTTQRTARSRARWAHGRRGASAPRGAAAVSARGGERWKSRRRTRVRSAAARTRPTRATPAAVKRRLVRRHFNFGSKAERSAGRVCSQAFRFKVGDEVVDQDGKRCRVVSVDTEDLEKPYELEYLNGSEFWAAESALRRHKVPLSGRRWILARSDRFFALSRTHRRAGRAGGLQVQGKRHGQSPEGRRAALRCQVVAAKHAVHPAGGA